jgi:hypothetical protein
MFDISLTYSTPETDAAISALPENTLFRPLALAL